MSKHIYIYSPSSAVRDKVAFRRGVKRLKALGHEVELDADALSSHQRFAGDDATRVQAITRAAASITKTFAVIVVLHSESDRAHHQAQMSLR